jgi:AcrR family transcriptional regulator
MMGAMAESKTKARQVVGKRRTRKHVQERGNTRRKQMLEAAEELLASVPIEELSFKQISEKAGVPEGSAYHFFANRYDLLTGLATELADRFGKRYRDPIPQKRVKSWHDIVDIVVDRAVKSYRESPAAMQIWLSGRTPAEVRLADHVSDKSVSSDLRSLFEEFFVLPDLPTDYDVFFYFLELSDVILSLSIIEKGELTEQMIEEAKRVGRGYLGTYLPPVLEKRH